MSAVRLLQRAKDLIGGENDNNVALAQAVALVSIAESLENIVFVLEERIVPTLARLK